MSQVTNYPKRGEVWLAKVDKIKEFSKDYRPVLIISGNLRNELDEAVVVAPLTTEDLENIEPYEIFINNTKGTGLDYPSKILLDSPFTFVKKLRLIKYLGTINKEMMWQVKQAWQIAFNWEE